MPSNNRRERSLITVTSVTEQTFDPTKRERLAKAGLAVEAALTGSWSSAT